MAHSTDLAEIGVPHQQHLEQKPFQAHLQKLVFGPELQQSSHQVHKEPQNHAACLHKFPERSGTFSRKRPLPQPFDLVYEVLGQSLSHKSQALLVFIKTRHKFEGRVLFFQNFRLLLFEITQELVGQQSLLVQAALVLLIIFQEQRAPPDRGVFVGL